MAFEENTVYPFKYFERTSAMPIFQEREREREIRKWLLKIKIIFQNND